MRTFWSGIVAATFVATVGLAAQQNPPAPGGAPGAGAPRPAPAPSAQATSQSKTVTLSGCIQSAPGASATAGGGAAGGGAAASTAKFVLANAKMSGAGAAGGAVGTAGSASRYDLSGEDKTISPHVNHQVEVTGTIESSASAGAAGAKASGPTLKVESVKMVSATCS